MTDNVKANYELINSIPIEEFARNGELVLKKVLKKIGRYEERGDIFFAHSNLEHASIKISAMFSEHYPGKSEKFSLLDSVFEEAFSAFFFSVAAHEPHLNRVVRFLEILISSSDQAQLVNPFIITKKGLTVSWPYFSEPLSEWTKNQLAYEICFTVAPEPTMESTLGGRTILSSKILTMSDIGRLEVFTRRRDILS